MTTATMPLFTIDTLQFSKRLHKAGLEIKVAEEIAEAIKDTHTQSLEGLATKHDILLVRKDIEALDKKFEQKFESFEQKFETLEYKLTIKMFAAIIVAVSIVT